jgi:hypothetical protein
MTPLKLKRILFVNLIPKNGLTKRKKRLTASNFAKVVKRKKQFTSAATSYGTTKEVKTKEKYTDKYTSIYTIVD